MMEQRAERSKVELSGKESTAEQYFKEAVFSKQNSKRPLGVTIEFPEICSLEPFLEVFGSDVRVAWDSGQEQKSLAIGVALEMQAEGHARFNKIQQHSKQLFDVFEHMAQNGDIQNNFSPRLFGGFCFQTDPRNEMLAKQEGQNIKKLWSSFGEAKVWLPKWLLCQDKGRTTLTYSTMSPHPEKCEKAVDELKQFFEAAKQNSTHPVKSSKHHPWAREHQTTLVAQEHMSLTEWKGLIQAAKNKIDKDAFSKVVLGRYSKVKFDKAPELSAVFSNLIRHPSKCTGFIFQMSDLCFVGATPERLVKKEDKKIFTEALAGTKKIDLEGESHEIGQKSLELFDDEKERHEHALVVEEIEKSLKPICDSLQIDAEPSLQKLHHMEHLRTHIEGAVQPNTHVLEIVERLHPTPAVAGSPRLEALEWIGTHEKDERGWFSGPIGWFDQHGDGEFLVALRSALIAENEAWIWSGAGIVEGSEAEKEYKETTLKMQPMLCALGVKEEAPSSLKE